MLLRAGYLALAQRLQEASDSLSQNDVRARLQDAVNDAHRGTGSYGYYVDHIGDDESGDCIYMCDGNMWSAPYELSSVGGKAAITLDTDEKKNIVPRTVYEEEADDDDHYAGMEESFKTQALYTGLPIYERYISKSERNAADEGSFAGKGKSFPILKPGDVQAAVHAMGRAGSSNYGPAQLKANIIRIAKKKGWTKYLPKAWQNGGDSEPKEATQPRETAPNSLKLHESAPQFCTELHLAEAARTHYPIKIISPGTGSSAHYTEAVLKASASRFGPGTLMFWNHPTAAEEAQRPEGNLDHLAAITTKPATWMDSGPKGPGLYAEAKVMADYAQKVEERAPHIGLSIRAGGTSSGKTVDGKPVLESIDYVESVDYVTKAGRGGLALAEAAREAGITIEEGTMDEANFKKLIEAEVAPLRLNEARRTAVDTATRLLAEAALPPAAKTRIIERATATVPLKDGALDADKFREQLLKEAKDEAAYLATLTGNGRVFGLGSSVAANTELTEAEEKRRRKEAKRARKDGEALREASVNVFAELMGGNKNAAQRAVDYNPAA